MRLGIGQWAKSSVIFLTSRVPESQLYGFSIYSAVGHVVFKNGRYL